MLLRFFRDHPVGVSPESRLIGSQAGNSLIAIGKNSFI